MGARMIEPTTPEEDEAFDNIERLSKIAQDLVRRQTELSQARNNVIEEVAQRFEKARDGCSPDDIMGRRWMDSAAELVRSMKK
jgi:glycine cleavage system protein P-like pyridoxal-binding family